MYSVSDNYTAFSADFARYIDCKVIVGDCTKNGTVRSWSDSRTYLSTDEIISIKITEGRTSGGFEIGLTYCKTLEAVFRTTAEITSNCRLKVFVRFKKGDTKTEWLPFGLFYADTISKSKTTISVTAMDKMLQLEKNYKSKLAYPCKLSDMLGEILGYYSAETAEGFKFLYDAVVSEKPVKGTDNDDNPIYYTRREILGYIGSACGGNALFDKKGDFNVTKYGEIADAVSSSSVISVQTDDVPFSIKKVIWNTSGVTMARDDEVEAYETVEFENLLQIQAKEMLMAMLEKKLIGVSYQPAVVKKQGYGYYELGDILKVPNESGELFPMLICGITYSLDSGGFTETITSLALSDSQANYKGTSKVGSNIVAESKNGNKFSFFSSNSDGTYTYNGVTYGFETDEETGYITRVYDNGNNGVIIDTTNAAVNSGKVDFNTAVMAMAMVCGIGQRQHGTKYIYQNGEINAELIVDNYKGYDAYIDVSWSDSAGASDLSALDNGYNVRAKQSNGLYWTFNADGKKIEKLAGSASGCTTIMFTPIKSMKAKKLYASVTFVSGQISPYCEARVSLVRAENGAIVNTNGTVYTVNSSLTYPFTTEISIDLDESIYYNSFSVQACIGSVYVDKIWVEY